MPQTTPIQHFLHKGRGEELGHRRRRRYKLFSCRLLTGFSSFSSCLGLILSYLVFDFYFYGHVIAQKQTNKQKLQSWRGKYYSYEIAITWVLRRMTWVYQQFRVIWSFFHWFNSPCTRSEAASTDGERGWKWIFENRFFATSSYWLIAFLWKYVHSCKISKRIRSRGIVRYRKLARCRQRWRSLPTYFSSDHFKFVVVDFTPHAFRRFFRKIGR